MTGVLLGLVLCLYPEAWRVAAPALSPFLALCAPLAVRTFGVGLLLALPMLVIVLMRRRFWCRHLCPVGLISESCGKLRGTRAAALRKTTRRPPARIFALATFGGAMVGYPMFLWMDPLALFAGFFSLARIAQPGVPALSVAGLPLVVLISFLYPGKWCSRLCPLGGTQDLLALAARRARGRRPQPQGRRALLTAGLGIVLSVVAGKLWAARRRDLRPPGAVDEAAFQGGCIRCGSCSRACPAKIIQPAVENGGVTGFLAPRLRFKGSDYCRQDCNLCGRVCPTGVIRLLPLAEKNRYVIGVAAIDLPECYLTLEKECGICVARCPRAAIVDVFVRETYQATVKVLREKCNGCGACVGICPPKAIRVDARNFPG